MASSAQKNTVRAALMSGMGLHLNQLLILK